MIKSNHVVALLRLGFDGVVAMVLFTAIMLVTAAPGFFVGAHFDLGDLWTVGLGALTHIILCQKILYAGYPFGTPPTI